MPSMWQRRYSAAVRDGELTLKRMNKRLGIKPPKITQELTKRFYCSETYTQNGTVQTCGYWDARYVWWNNGYPHCDVHRTPLEVR